MVINSISVEGNADPEEIDMIEVGLPFGKRIFSIIAAVLQAIFTICIYFCTFIVRMVTIVLPKCILL